MIEFLQDKQFIGLLLPIGATVVIFLIQLWLRRKALSYEIISRTPLLNPQEKDKRNLQILFDNNQVQDVDIIEVEIFNSGNEEIRPNDYERPISVNFDKNTQILTAEVAKVNPLNLKPSVKIEGISVILEPLLLNKKDSIKLKMLVSKCSNNPTVSARIAGVKEIKESSEKQNRVLLSIITGGTLGVIASIMLIILYFSAPPQITSALILWSVLLFYCIIGYFLMVTGFFVYRDIRKKAREFK